MFVYGLRFLCVFVFLIALLFWFVLVLLCFKFLECVDYCMFRLLVLLGFVLWFVVLCYVLLYVWMFAWLVGLFLVVCLLEYVVFVGFSGASLLDCVWIASFGFMVSFGFVCLCVWIRLVCCFIDFYVLWIACLFCVVVYFVFLWFCLEC